MTKPIELIASTANWLSHATKTCEDNGVCLIPTGEIFDTFYDVICAATPCAQCPHWSKHNITEIVNVLYRPFK